MTSEIRVNSITNRSGLSTVTWNDEGLDVVGVVTATSFIGSTGTFSSDVTISGDLGVAGTLTYEDVTRVDAIGLSTYREGLHIGPLAGIGATVYKDGSIRTSGVITATTYYGSGAQLTGITGTTINNNATTKFITGTNNANELDCEANLSYNNSVVTFASSSLMVDKSSNPTISAKETSGNKEVQLRADTTGGLLRTAGSYPLVLATNQTERLRIDANGKVIVAAGQLHSSRVLARFGIDCQGMDIYDGVGVVANYGMAFYNDPTSNKANGIGFFNDDGQTCGGYIVHQDKGSGNLGDIVMATSETSNTPVERLRITSAGKVNITPGGALSGSNPPGDLNIVGTNFLTMTPNDNTNASDNEVLGRVAFLPYAAGTVASASAKIEAVAVPTQSGSANPSMLTFYTKSSSTGPGSSATERLRIDSNGYVTTPSQPVFHVQLEGHKNATQNPLIFTDIRVNNGSHYNSGNGRFTAPCSGMYYFFFQGIKNSNSGAVTRVYIQKNGSYIYDDYHLRIQEEGNYANGCTNWIIQLSTNDYITLKLSAGGLHAAEYTHFGGYLIG